MLLHSFRSIVLLKNDLKFRSITSLRTYKTQCTDSVHGLLPDVWINTHKHCLPPSRLCFTRQHGAWRRCPKQIRVANTTCPLSPVSSPNQNILKRDPRPTLLTSYLIMEFKQIISWTPSTIGIHQCNHSSALQDLLCTSRNVTIRFWGRRSNPNLYSSWGCLKWQLGPTHIHTARWQTRTIRALPRAHQQMWDVMRTRYTARWFRILMNGRLSPLCNQARTQVYRVPPTKCNHKGFQFARSSS